MSTRMEQQENEQGSSQEMMSIFAKIQCYSRIDDECNQSCRTSARLEFKSRKETQIYST